MSEKIEFIAAKDLPVAEGNEVDVLCMENGELKRKEGTSLGSNGGDPNLFVVHPNGFAEEGFFVKETFEEISIAVDEGKTVLLNAPANVYNATQNIATLCYKDGNKICFVGFYGKATDNMNLKLYTIDSSYNTCIAKNIWSWT